VLVTRALAGSSALADFVLERLVSIFTWKEGNTALSVLSFSPD
jgi:hypothetical protein